MTMSLLVSYWLDMTGLLISMKQGLVCSTLCFLIRSSLHGDALGWPSLVLFQTLKYLKEKEKVSLAKLYEKISKSEKMELTVR